jgi:hypothetical protein
MGKELQRSAISWLRSGYSVYLPKVPHLFPINAQQLFGLALLGFPFIVRISRHNILLSSCTTYYSDGP